MKHNEGMNMELFVMLSVLLASILLAVFYRHTTALEWVLLNTNSALVLWAQERRIKAYWAWRKMKNDAEMWAQSAEYWRNVAEQASRKVAA